MSEYGQGEGRAVEAAWREALELQRVARDRALEDRGTVVTRVRRVWTAR